MDDKSIIKSYKRVSGFYDYTFGQIFRPGQKKLVSMMECTPTDKVLEIGIGTGTSYKYYPMETEVTGIDISPDMLEKAKKNIRKHNLQNKNVIMMNGSNLHLRIILLIKLLDVCGFGDAESEPINQRNEKSL
ncbi:MAG: hypothetical protein CM15mP53_09820 [Ectothiorhodospiraceae bacterium]|nr:MAG: hypothetical protein CM15mP53_09820 [Ectothiorhodospiraceae bacterium]